LNIAPGSDACTFDGKYEVYGFLECILADQNACPTLPGTNQVIVDLQVASEDFCPVSNTDVKLNGLLRVFDDNAYSNPKTQFVIGTESYYELNVSSAAVTVTGVAITQITLSNPQGQLGVFNSAGTAFNQWIIYNNAWAANAGASAEMLTPFLASNGPHQRFHFSLTKDLLNIVQDLAVNVTITAKANVTYLDTPTGKKRSALISFAVNNQPQSYGSTFGISNPQQRVTSGAFKVVSSLPLILVVLLGLFL